MNSTQLDIDVVQVMAPQMLTLPPMDEFGRSFSEAIRVDDHLGVELLVSYGAVSTTGATEFFVQHSSSSSADFASVADSDLLGTEALLSIPAATSRTSGVDQNIARRIGYRGNYPWLRVGFKNKQRGQQTSFVVSIDALLLRVNRG